MTPPAGGQSGGGAVGSGGGRAAPVADCGWRNSGSKPRALEQALAPQECEARRKLQEFLKAGPPTRLTRAVPQAPTLAPRSQSKPLLESGQSAEAYARRRLQEILAKCITKDLRPPTVAKDDKVASGAGAKGAVTSLQAAAAVAAASPGDEKRGRARRTARPADAESALEAVEGAWQRRQVHWLPTGTIAGTSTARGTAAAATTPRGAARAPAATPRAARRGGRGIVTPARKTRSSGGTVTSARRLGDRCFAPVEMAPPPALSLLLPTCRLYFF